MAFFALRALLSGASTSFDLSGRAYRKEIVRSGQLQDWQHVGRDLWIGVYDAERVVPEAKSVVDRERERAPLP